MPLLTNYDLWTFNYPGFIMTSRQHYDSIVAHSLRVRLNTIIFMDLIRFNWIGCKLWTSRLDWIGSSKMDPCPTLKWSSCNFFGFQLNAADILQLPMKTLALGDQAKKPQHERTVNRTSKPSLSDVVLTAHSWSSESSSSLPRTGGASNSASLRTTAVRCSWSLSKRAFNSPSEAMSTARGGNGAARGGKNVIKSPPVDRAFLPEVPREFATPTNPTNNSFCLIYTAFRPQIKTLNPLMEHRIINTASEMTYAVSGTTKLNFTRSPKKPSSKAAKKARFLKSNLSVK